MSPGVGIMWSALFVAVVTLSEFSMAKESQIPLSSDAVENRREVGTESGVVRGFLKNDGDGEYMAFLGIPYAAPPTGSNRFKAPLPPEPWKGIFQANHTVTCPQQGTGDEDCLIVNVFTPTNIVNGPLAVLVYIHGGSFLLGSGQTQGVAPLIKQNVIVVTLNYRLGALGFLCLGIDEAPGNAGLKDQAAALRWVQRNVRNFGGDPTQVTLYGMSAGGASVEFQVLAKTSKGLFEKAIIESASSTPVWTTDFEPIQTAVKLAKRLHYSKRTKNLYNLARFYQQVSADKLSQVNYDYYSDLIDGTFGMVPCLERPHYDSRPFMTEPPIDTLTKDNYDKVPMMFLFSTMEGLYLRSPEYYSKDYKDRMNKYFFDFLPADLAFDTGEIRGEIGENIRRFYFGNETIGDKTIIQYLNYFGDNLILHGLLESVEFHARNSNPVYLMEFAYKGGMGSYEKFYDGIKFAGHGDVIKHAILNKPIQSKSDQLAVDRVAKLIANFVKFSNPSPSRTQLLPVIWPRVHPSNVSYLLMNEELLVHEEPYWGRKRFWDGIYASFRRPVKGVGAS